MTTPMDRSLEFSDVTAVIPTKDEAGCVADVIRRCRQITKNVLVVDGASTDETVAIARAEGATVVNDGGGGKGLGIRAAIPHVTTDIVVFVDADGSHDPADIPKLVEPIRLGIADHVTASRLLGGSSELHGGFDEFFRLAGSAFITACINWRFHVALSDSQNGFRAVRTAVLRQLPLQERCTTIEQEMIIKTLKLGYRMMDVPSHEYRRRFGKGHIRISRVAYRYVYSMVKYLFFWRAPRGLGRSAVASGVCLPDSPPPSPAESGLGG